MSGLLLYFWRSVICKSSGLVILHVIRAEFPTAAGSRNDEFCQGVRESVNPAACLPIVNSCANMSHALSSLSCIPKSTKCNKPVFLSLISVENLSKNSLTVTVELLLRQTLWLVALNSHSEQENNTSEFWNRQFYTSSDTVQGVHMEYQDFL